MFVSGGRLHTLLSVTAALIRAARAGGARCVLRTVVLDELAIVNGERQHVTVARYGTHFAAVVVYYA